MKQFGVIGLGRFGRSVANALVERGFEVLAIDRDERCVKDLEGKATVSLVLNALDEKALRDAGVADLDCVIVAIGDSIEDSIMVTMVLKSLGVKYIVAKAQDDLHGKILARIGADRVIYPERDMGIRLAESLAAPKIFDVIELSTTHGIVETPLPKRFVGKTLGEAKLREKYHVSVIAIKRKAPYMTKEGTPELKEEVIIAPGADDELIEGDVLVILGAYTDIDKLTGK
ncbi:TrkA family potassium uptake protein [candidate division WOR-3 bacterium]|uniref:TrkA family potassium uptake protein n=1 Tax=candidate division WOR-3 bacterium TaxID=2052148 RepID=A0A660SHP0_UNCW3|nr:MAG: TrkA family potassium uptake protein [candidate division WOR-3 bacterium]